MQQIDKKESGLPTEFSDLPLGEQIVLWGFRMWAKAFNQNTNISYLLQIIFGEVRHYNYFHKISSS